MNFDPFNSFAPFGDSAIVPDFSPLDYLPIACVLQENYDPATGTWTDSSGYGNHLVQPYEPYRPQKASNGAVSFTGGLSKLSIIGLGDLSEYTAFGVASKPASANGRVFSDDYSHNWLMGWWGFLMDAAYSAGDLHLFSGMVPTNDGSRRLYAMGSDGTVSSFWGNGTLIASGSGFGPFNTFQLGNIEACDCEVCAYIIYPRFLGTVERQNVEAYLRARFAPEN